MMHKEEQGFFHSKTWNRVLLLSTLLFALLWLSERLKWNLPIIGSNERFVSTTTQALDSLSEQLNLRMVQIKQLGGKVNELEKVKAQIEGDKKNLSENSFIDVEEFKKKLSYYTRLLFQKDQEIKKLKKENSALLAKNDSLSRETKLLQDGLSNVQRALRDSSVTYFAKQREWTERSKFLEVKNKELSDKVNVAAALRAEGVNVYAITSRGKEAGIQGQKAKRIEKIRIIFHLQENALTEKELKTIYLRLIEPTGQVISDYNLGSGTFSFRGREMAYTAKQRIFYENNHQSVEFYYVRPNAFKEGRHEIELYAEGYLIGLGSFDVH